MGAVVPFERPKPAIAPPFDEPQLSALWASYSAARQAEVILVTHGAADRDVAAARHVADLAHCLFKDAMARCDPKGAA